jgi:hypothetical protein
MAPAKEGNSEAKEGLIDELVEKVKIIVRGPHGALFSKVVEDFFEVTEPEFFSDEDLADIQAGVEEISQGKYLTLEDYRQGKRL